MSLGASATYIGNDLWDLDNDRRHPRKRNRPFASGALSITEGVGCAALLLTLAFALAFAVSVEFAGMFVLYLVLTTSYSWRLKSVVLLDVVVLSLLYTYRIIAGRCCGGNPGESLAPRILRLGFSQSCACETLLRVGVFASERQEHGRRSGLSRE
jgi:4-hydroxybenzoate polyprenyltransferase